MIDLLAIIAITVILAIKITEALKKFIRSRELLGRVGVSIVRNKSVLK